MEMNSTTLLSIGALLIGAFIFLVSVSGVFWPATPATDPGMLWTSVVFVLFGALGLLMARRQAQPEEY